MVDAVHEERQAENIGEKNEFLRILLAGREPQLIRFILACLLIWVTNTRITIPIYF